MRTYDRLFVLSVLCCVSAAGCSSLATPGVTSSDGGLTKRALRSPRDVALASHSEPVDEVERESSLDVEDFYPANLGQTVKILTGNGPDREKARQLYGEGEQTYREALAAREKDDDADVKDLFVTASASFEGAASRWPDSALEEDALFRAGESQFFADRYVESNDIFERLLKKYPNSRYLDLIGARRFLIAQYWLQLDADPSFTSIRFDFTDKSHPWLDTFGHAVRIYDRMRLDDPTGKLADDATLAAANAYFKRGLFTKADHYYSDLRTHFPSSEHQFNAHYLGIQAKLKGYLGPDYAGGALDEAGTLIKQVRRQFPQQAREHRDELDRAYGEVRYRKAEREWSMAQYYQRRREFGAARFYYDLLLADYSDTPFAEKSRERIEAIAGKPLTPPQKMQWLVQLFPDEGKPLPMVAVAPEETQRR